MTNRILVIEDEHVMRELLRLHLSSAGYAVETASSRFVARTDCWAWRCAH